MEQITYLNRTCQKCEILARHFVSLAQNLKNFVIQPSLAILTGVGPFLGIVGKHVFNTDYVLVDTRGRVTPLVESRGGAPWSRIPGLRALVSCLAVLGSC